MKRYEPRKNKINELSATQKLCLFFVVQMVLTCIGILIYSSDGFCHERHNGTYCYNIGYSKYFLTLCPFFAQLSLIVYVIEKKLGKTIKLFQAPTSAFIMFLISPSFSIVLFLAGPN